MDYTADEKGYRPVLTVKQADSESLSAADGDRPALAIEEALEDLIPAVLSDPVPIPEKQKPEADPVMMVVQEPQEKPAQPEEAAAAPAPEDDISNDAVIVEAAVEDDVDQQPVDQQTSSQVVNAAYKAYMEQLAELEKAHQEDPELDLLKLVGEKAGDDPEFQQHIRKLLEEELEKLASEQAAEDDHQEDDDEEIHQLAEGEQEYLRKLLLSSSPYSYPSADYNDWTSEQVIAYLYALAAQQQQSQEPYDYYRHQEPQYDPYYYNPYYDHQWYNNNPLYYPYSPY